MKSLFCALLLAAAGFTAAFFVGCAGETGVGVYYGEPGVYYGPGPGPWFHGGWVYGHPWNYGHGWDRVHPWGP